MSPRGITWSQLNHSFWTSVEPVYVMGRRIFMRGFYAGKRGFYLSLEFYREFLDIEVEIGFFFLLKNSNFASNAI